MRDPQLGDVYIWFEGARSPSSSRPLVTITLVGFDAHGRFVCITHDPDQRWIDRTGLEDMLKHKCLTLLTSLE